MIRPFMTILPGDPILLFFTLISKFSYLCQSKATTRFICILLSKIEYMIYMSNNPHKFQQTPSGPYCLLESQRTIIISQGEWKGSGLCNSILLGIRTKIVGINSTKTTRSVISNDRLLARRELSFMLINSGCKL